MVNINFSRGSIFVIQTPRRFGVGGVNNSCYLHGYPKRCGVVIKNCLETYSWIWGMLAFYVNMYASAV